LHPELGKIVTLFRKTSPGTNLQILTGGIFRERLLDELLPEDSGLLFNINEPRDYRNPQLFKQVLENVEAAIRKGFRVMLGFNVWRLDFDPDFIPDLAWRLGRSSFRWTLANPQWGSPTCVIRPEEHRLAAERCLVMLKRAAEYSIEASLDCPLPLCFFSEADLAWVRQYQGGTASRLGTCSPVIDVTPELEAIRCFALSKTTRIQVTDFPNEWAIIQWFQKHVDAQLLPSGYFPECGQCPHFLAGRCSAGCLAWRECAFETGVETKVSSLARTMYAKIEKGDIESALRQYEEAGYWLKTDLPSYLAAVAAWRLGDQAKAFRYAARAQDTSIEPDLKQRIKELMKEIRLDAPGDTPCSLPKIHSLPFVTFPEISGK
jgi:cyclic pyranopterin phosphate synthase